MFAFISKVVLISLSGVMSPGPLSAVIAGKGNESPPAGAFIAIGRGLVEVPLMVALLFGTSRLLATPLRETGHRYPGSHFVVHHGGWDVALASPARGQVSRIRWFAAFGRGLVDDRQSVFPHLVGNDRYHPDLPFDGLRGMGFRDHDAHPLVVRFQLELFPLGLIVQGRPVFWEEIPTRDLCDLWDHAYFLRREAAFRAEVQLLA